MTDAQWENLLRGIDGQRFDPLPVALLVDGPWLADWSGAALMDYFTSDRLWLEANLDAFGRFPQVTFMTGFWAEYGMSTNPSAFGARCIWPADGFPSPQKILQGYADIDSLQKPNCRTDGLLPFVIKRLQRAQARIEAAGHRIRFATAHGPITIGSYLLGHTELLVGMRTDPGPVHRLLETATEFVVDWIAVQRDAFPSIGGMLVLEDLMGFLGEIDFGQFALPYMKRIFESQDLPVKFLHNDAYGLVTAGHLAEMGVNLFNFSFEHSFAEIRALAGDSVTLMGNIPPRDVMSLAAPDDVRRWVVEALGPLKDKTRILVSAGGFVPPGTSAENIEALLEAVAEIR
jgi:uroporphyrinogen decarboxylase